MNDLEKWFAHLIDDRPGNFASRIVEALQGEGIAFPLELAVDVGPEPCRVILAYNPSNRRFVVSRHPGGPVVDFRGHPATWSRLETFRNAVELDKAFRGCNPRFDADLS